MSRRRLFLLKVQGRVKIPDYVQVRDERQSLLAYFRADRPEQGLERVPNLSPEAKARLATLIRTLPYGKLVEVEL
ncbi:MAG: fructose-6-phosphate aldolase [Bacteroidetes bacterium]|nr:fructose-6-phosphate aldolase [Rhodothermia bacterium]MCS7154849.1 fructose-6-phosphate aldolase [Bacteroidota bacterium]MCX7906993.1 fructose-6-phosphate aldolase [Bacteroidota bacterium]MDW8137643.1 fructose-6-phosphate aldolase [Bacteroidota bacterium]MDW8285403.1 fructose-6-phosphate aldolase [Bacteroidota bacterium]